MGAITTSTVPSRGSSFTRTEKAPVWTVPRLTFTARKQGAHQRSMGWLPGTLMSPTLHLVCLGLCSCFPFSMSLHLSCVLGSLLNLLLCFTVSLLKNLLLPSCFNCPPLISAIISHYWSSCHLTELKPIPFLLMFTVVCFPMICPSIAYS